MTGPANSSSTERRTAERKRACTACKARKIRCDGALPSCGRCARLKLNCHHSPGKPLGRPRKEISLASSLNPPTDSSNFTTPTDLCRHRQLPPAPPQDSLPGPAEALHFGSTTCACISILYLALDELRAIPHFHFPGSLPPLRASLASAADALKCQVCPRRFLSAMQNARLIGVVLLSVAECYSKILDSITPMELSPGNPNVKRTVNLQSLDSGHEETSATTPFNVSFTVELDEAEWLRLARKSLLREIHDISDASRDCFISVLTNLERRQVFWHTLSPPPDAPSTFQNTCSPDRPGCLLMADESRRLIDALKFD